MSTTTYVFMDKYAKLSLNDHQIPSSSVTLQCKDNHGRVETTKPFKIESLFLYEKIC